MACSLEPGQKSKPLNYSYFIISEFLWCWGLNTRPQTWHTGAGPWLPIYHTVFSFLQGIESKASHTPDAYHVFALTAPVRILYLQSCTQNCDAQTKLIRKCAMHQYALSLISIVTPSKSKCASIQPQSTPAHMWKIAEGKQVSF